MLALVLAAAGIYGVMAHLVALRTPEIGVRLTLGARPVAVMRQVLGEGAVQAAIGLAIGLGASLAVMQGLRSILFGVEPTDPLTLVSVGGLADAGGAARGDRARTAGDADRSGHRRFARSSSRVPGFQRFQSWFSDSAALERLEPWNVWNPWSLI